MSVAGRVAVVTGGAGAIGGAIAERLAHDGARVRIVDVALPKTTSEAGIQARAIDVGDRAAVAATFAAPDWAPEILVNVAGVFGFEDIADPSSTEWEETVRVNLTGVYNCCHAAAASMRERRFGRIVSISSNAAVIGFRGMPSYSASKAGIIGLSRALAVDLGPYDITVNVVAPGSIDAGMGIASGWTSDPRMRAWDASRTPLRRAGRVEDVAGAVAFLVSDDASWITGQTLVVDGGFSIDGGPDPMPDSAP